MSTQNIKTAADRAIASYTMMGMRGDQHRRELLRETAAVHIQGHVDRGEDDPDRLVVLGLKYLVSLERNRVSPRHRASD
jgi:hypothetical protein